MKCLMYFLKMPHGDMSWLVTLTTAVVWGEADPILLSSWADRLEEYFSHLVHVQMLSGVGHFTPFEAPDAIVEAINAVL